MPEPPSPGNTHWEPRSNELFIDHAPVPTFLPEWLKRSRMQEQKSTTRPEFEQALNEGPADPATTLSNGLESTSLADFLVALDSCNNFEDIQRLASDRPFATNPLHSHAAFRHLLKQNPSMDLIISFVENSKMHSAGGGNLQFLVATHLESKMINQSAIILFSHWIRKQVGLGLLSHTEIVSLLTTVTGFLDSEPQEYVYTKIWRKMWGGINECPSYKSNVQISAFYRFVKDRDSRWGILFPAARRLGLELVKSHVHLDLGAQQLCLYEFIRDWRQERPVPAGDLCVRMDKGSSLLGLLQAFPAEMVKHCLRDASKVMLTDLLAIDSHDEATVSSIQKFRELGFKTLEDFACIKVWENVELTLAQKGINVVSSYVAHMDPQSLCIFVLKHWYTRTVCQQLKTDYSSLSSSLLGKFKEITLREPLQKPFLNLLITIQSFNYPFPLDIQKRVLDLLRALNMSATIFVLLTSPKTRLEFHFTVVLAKIRYYLSKGQNRIAYSIFRGYRGIAFEHVPELVETVIKDLNLPVEIAFNYHQNLIRRRCGQKTSTSRYPLTASRLEVHNRMALAYATAAHLSPRQAYRMAYLCYRACKQEKLPITAAMTRALTLAGCIRYLKQWRWASTLRFRWIVERVREVEGDEVADKLDEMAFEWREMVLKKRRTRQMKERALGSRSVEPEGG